MYTNANLAAPLAALALLGTAFLLFVGAVVLVQSLIVRQGRRAKIVFLAIVSISGLYAGAIVAFSLTSHAQVLERGAEKHFCELDCHLAYSIVKVKESASASDAANHEILVTVKTRFDETTISPARGNAPLYPNSRVVTLFDDRGNRYAPASQAGSQFSTSLRPGESYATELAFHLPHDAKPAKLLINEGEWITHFVIGHENSPLHRKTEFQL